ncbi:transcription factor GTE8-like isoform X2 [Prunus dulcis]|uniref:transcription factor GTE8-like isoform X2 n=1 Tax=Prunus dulcis TaxID=3755 RepID=UPI0014821C0E|nr:transcription factor GTE8-like isoform X2 [Prunus dulcis]
MAKKNKNPGRGGYYGGAFEQAGECEGSGSSGRIDAEITASEDSSAPTRKCISLNSSKRDSFGVPIEVLPLSNMLSSERKDLLHRLRMELEQIRILQKKVEMHRTNGVTVSSSSDILSCNNGRNGPHIENLRKSSALTGQGKKLNPVASKAQAWNPGTSGRVESVNQASAPSTASVILMKQCETLLKRLMSHQFSWVFNTPVDVVKLKIPDYFTVIKHPMDLGTVKTKIASGSYSSPLEFAADVRTTFTNAMTYNPPTNDVYVMADTLSKFFEVRWKTIEKKLPKADCQPPPAKSGPHEAVETPKPLPPAKKRMITSLHHEVKSEPAKQVMTKEEKHNLSRDLESLHGEIPLFIIDFLRENCSNGKDSEEDEIEIDVDDLSDDTLFTLRKLLNEHLQEKQKNHVRAEPCSIELLNESGLSNSSMQPCKADEDVDIGGNEPPVSSYPPVEIEKDTGYKISKGISSSSSSDSDSSSSESECDDAKASSPVPETVGSGAQLDEKTIDSRLEGNQSNGSFLQQRPLTSYSSGQRESDSGLDQVEQSSQQKPSPVESDCCQDGDSAPTERPVSPEKQYRAALLKNRFADTILRAREKTLNQGDKGDPEKLRQEREELELQQKKEKARLQAEAKAAEDARRRAEAEAAAEAKRKRELEREAARQALLQIEKTVEINENSQFLQDLEMLRTAPVEQLPSSVDETSPDHSQDGLGGFRFGGSNPLEQLGLYIKDDEEEEEIEPAASVPSPVNDIEEGEID